MLQYDGFTLEFDVNSYEDVYKYDMAAEAFALKTPQILDSASPHDFYGELIKAYDRFIDDIFGEGTAKKIFADNQTEKSRVEFVKSLKAHIIQGMKDSAQRMTEDLKLMERFAPS